MASIEDVRAIKAARNAFGKWGIDVTHADIRLHHGIVQVRGLLKPLKGFAITDLRAQTENVSKALRGSNGIKDVVIDCQMRNM